MRICRSFKSENRKFANCHISGKFRKSGTFSFAKSTTVGICDLRNLFADRPPVTLLYVYRSIARIFSHHCNTINCLKSIISGASPTKTVLFSLSRIPLFIRFSSFKILTVYSWNHKFASKLFTVVCH